MRSDGIRGTTAASLLPLALLVLFVAGWPLVLLGGAWLVAWVLVWAMYLGIVLLNALLGGLRFRSLRVAALAFVGSIAVHLTYAAALVLGLIRG